MVGDTGRLLERDDALAMVSQAMESAQDGRGCMIAIQAEAGLGKSTLLAKAAELAGPGWSRMQATGSEIEAELPFAYMQQLGGSLRATDDALRAAPDPLGRRAFAHDLARRQLQEWTSSGELLVLLDDLHWSDPDSIGILAFLARRLERLPVTLVAALRPWPEHASMTIEALGVRRVALAPLSRGAGDELLNELLGVAASPPLAQRVWELACGNPQLISEAARAIRTDGDLPRRDSRRPPAVMRRVLLLNHLAGLGPAAITCAQAAVTLGGRFRIAVVDALTGLEPAEFASAFDALVASGVLRELKDGCAEFTHELLAWAIREDMTPATRRLFHVRAFDYYFATGERPAAAPHALAANLVGNHRAIEVLADAGAQALSQGAVETGLAYLAGAVTLAKPMPSDRLLATYADGLFAVGRHDQSAEVSERLLAQTTDHVTRTETRSRIARALAHAGRLDEALGWYDELLADSDGAASASVLLEFAHASWERDGPGGALAALERTRTSDSSKVLAEMVAPVRAFFALEAGDPSGIQTIERCAQAARRHLASRPQDVMVTTNALALQVAALGAVERLDEALELIAEGVSWLLAAGGLRAVVPLRTARIGILLQQGWIERVLEECDDLYSQLEVDALSRPVIELFRARALVWLGRTAEARAICDAVMQSHEGQSWYARMNLGMVRGLFLRLDGGLDSAVAEHRELEQLARRFGLSEPHSPPWAIGAIETFLDARLAADAARIADWLEHTGSFQVSPWPRMVALSARAGCAAATGDVESAESLYLQSLSVPCEAPLDRAQIQLRYGTWQRRAGRQRAARAALAEALETGRRHGARALTDRASEELRAAGGRRRRPGEDGDALTAAEVRVAKLAATGATNPEIAQTLFLSPRTVESHLSRVYAKLGIKDRRELRRRAGELPLGAEAGERSGHRAALGPSSSRP